MPVDIVIPVYRGERDVRRCLASVWSSVCETSFEIIVVDDASPEPALSAWLDRQAELGRITLLRNARNLGFVGSVNRGMSLHPARDVLLLNSDTEVANDWLDRIVRCARSGSDIGTVTPFSNNATICSYPFDGWTGEVPGTLGLQGLDRLFAQVNAARLVEIPTAVGFCMFIRRACLDALGLFDAASFGRGYGEENDFSLRAAKAGWRNVLCADTFVYHHGGVSFGVEREVLMRQAASVLLALHPDYDDRVNAFVRADPVKSLRDAIDQARLASGGDEAQACRLERQDPVLAARSSAARSRGTIRQGEAPRHERVGLPVVLHLSHGWGGGIARWIADYAAADEQCWHLVLRSETDRNASAVALHLADVLADETPLLSWALDQPIGATATHHAGYDEVLKGLADSFDVQAFVVSSLIGHSLAVFRQDRPVMVMLHDLYPYCPALFGWFKQPCGDCDQQRLQQCLRTNPLNVFWYEGDVSAWSSLRDAYGACLMRSGVRVVAPSLSVLERYRRLFPVLTQTVCEVVPHGLAVIPERLPVFGEMGGATRRLRIVVPGRLAPHKGLGLLGPIFSRLTEFAEVLLLGCGAFGEPFEGMAHVEVVRDFEPSALAAEVTRFEPDCALLLSVLPESFSYTLSEMQALGVPVVATAMGALRERITDGEDGILVEPEAEAVLRVMRGLADAPGPLQSIRACLASRAVPTAAAVAVRYRELLGFDKLQPLTRPSSMLTALAAEAVGAKVQVLHWTARTDECRSVSRAAVEAQSAELAAREEEVRHLLRSVSELEAHRDAILRSTFWRMTAPLRWLVDCVRGLAKKGRTQQTSVPESLLRSHEAVLKEELETRRPQGRMLERRLCRERLFLSDVARVVLGAGFVGDGTGFEFFARYAMKVGDLRTGWYFVWCGDRDDAWLRAHWGDVGVAVATRRLFIVDRAELQSWLIAADAYLSCVKVEEGLVIQPGTIGLPVAVAVLDTDRIPLVQIHTEGGVVCPIVDWLDRLDCRI